MQKVGIRFKPLGKIHFFDTGGLDINIDDYLVVDYQNGLDFVKCVIGPRDMKDGEELPKVVRIATSDDFEQVEENIRNAKEAFDICIEKIEKFNLEMKLIDCEYRFDKSKLLFNFTADERVNFRELVRELAFVFKTRIELRQINTRDETKKVKGLACCGREVCCGSFMDDFVPVSIKMAKDQNLSLNPIKISGLCGRLMCCLKFEHDGYVQLRVDMPNRGDKVMTKEGKGVVIDTNILKEEIKVRHIDEKSDELSVDISTYTKGDFTITERNTFSEHHDDGEEFIQE